MRGTQAFPLGGTLAVLVAAAACNGPATHEPPDADDRSPAVVEVGAGESFTLAPGGSARIAGADLTVRFVEVASDSRCPTDVQCVWAGDAVVVVETVSESAERIWRLHTPTEIVGPGGAEVNGHVLRLVGLEPGHLEGEVTPQEEYRATFTVSAAEPGG